MSLELVSGILIALLLLLAFMLVALISYIIGRRTMADFTRQKEVLAALKTSVNQLDVTSQRAIAVIQSPDTDQSQIDAITDEMVQVEQQVARINQDLVAALPPQPTPQPIR